MEKNKDIIFSKLLNVVINVVKKRVWESICERINFCNFFVYIWIVEEIRKKWFLYISDMKKKVF